MTDVTLGYAYGNGRLSAMTRTANGLGQTYNMGYDGFGKLTEVKVGTRSLAGYTYGANDGLLTQMTYGNGNTVAYDYDDLERVKNIYYNNSSSPAYTYTYKGEGTLGQLTDNTNNRTYAYTYDSLGRLNGLTEQFGGVSVQTFSASYDTANRPTNVTYAVSPAWNGTLGSNRVYTYTYSANDGSLTSMTGPGASMAYTYDGLKRLMKRVVSSDSSEVVTRNYSYLAGSGSNTSPLVSSLTANHGSTNLFSGNYSYDSVGNITAITGSAPASYTYDSQNQLLTEVRGGTTYTYTYDAAGNMLSKTKTSGSGTDTFTYGNAEWRDLLTAYNGNAITYDTVGNPTTWYDGAAMTWVNGKRLASISATSGHSALAFTYDVDGLRLTKTVGTGSSAVEHKYTWQGGKLVSENYGTTTLEFFYDESGAPYAFSYNGTTYYYVTNLQGDVVKIVNASGTSQAEYSYNAWGQVISATGTLAAINPIRYRGYYYDVETGLYYLKSRYYDPQICRFINADGLASTGQGFLGCNMFAYCLNNSVNGVDPSGSFPLWLIPTLIAALLLTGCSKDKDAPDGYIDSNDIHPNAHCYSYALSYIGLTGNGWIDPGEFMSRKMSSNSYHLSSRDDPDSIQAIDECFSSDLDAFDYVYTSGSYNNVQSMGSEHQIIAAMRVYDNGLKQYGYHFAVQLNNGMWADKPGGRHSRYGKLTFDGSNWDDSDGYYTCSASDTVFFAIKVG